MNKRIVTEAKTTQKTKNIKCTKKLKLIKIININGGWQWSFWAKMRALDIVTRKHWRIHVNIGQRKQSFLLRRKRSMFRNTKKINMVQEHQKIKYFSLWELTKQRQNKRNTKCKGITILNHNQIRPRKKNSIFSIARTQKSKLFEKKLQL